MINLSSIGTVSYSISLLISQVWDVTDIFNASKVEILVNTLILKREGELRKYIALDPSDYTPLQIPKPKEQIRIDIDHLHLLF
jgi:hypothetical protein